MPDPAIGALSPVLIDTENPGGWNEPSKTAGVNYVPVSAGGSGYTSGATVGFSGGTPTRVAAGYVVCVANAVTAVYITDAGAGYASAPTATITPVGAGSGATCGTVLLGAYNAHQIGVVQETILPTQDLLDNPTLRGDFNAPDPTFGKKAAAGSLIVIPNQQLLPLFFRQIVGEQGEVTTGAGPYTHTAKLGAYLPLSFKIEKQMNIGGSMRYMLAKGARINQMTIPLDSVGLTQWSLDMMAADVAVNTTSLFTTSTDWRSLGTPQDFLQFAAADVKIGGSAVAYIKKGSIQIGLNLAADDYRAGAGGARGSLTPQQAKISGTLTLVLDSTAVLTLLTAGTASALSLKWTMGGGHSFELDLDRIFIMKTAAAIKDGGPVEVDATFRGVYDVTNVTSFRAIIINDQVLTAYK
jgi:hypothetical protein